MRWDAAIRAGWPSLTHCALAAVEHCEVPRAPLGGESSILREGFFSKYSNYSKYLLV